MEKLSLHKVMQQIRQLFTHFLITLALGLTATFSALAQYHPFEATYVAYRFGDDVGHATLSLQRHSDEHYRLEYYSKVSKFFLTDKRREVSIFSIDDTNLIPYQYDYKRSGTGRDKRLNVQFDAENEQIMIDGKPVFSWNGETDNQLYRLELSSRLAAGESEFEYHFINSRGELRHYRILVMGKEQLELPFGMLEGIKVKIQRETNKRETFAWFAPSLNYALVRLQQFKEGEEQGQIKLQHFRSLTASIAE